MIVLFPSARDGAIWLAPFVSFLLVAVLATSISSSVLRASEILSAVANLMPAALIGLLALLLPLVGAHSVGTQRANQLAKKVNSGASRHSVGSVGHPDQMATLNDCNESFCVVMEEGKDRALPIQNIRC